MDLPNTLNRVVCESKESVECRLVTSLYEDTVTGVFRLSRELSDGALLDYNVLKIHHHRCGLALWSLALVAMPKPYTGISTHVLWVYHQACLDDDEKAR